MEVFQLMTTVLMFIALVSIACRIGGMNRGKTKPEVFWQHAALGMGVGAALLFPTTYPLTYIMAGVVLFLLIGTKRWKHGAPDGTKKPDDLESVTWPFISGRGSE